MKLTQRVLLVTATLVGLPQGAIGSPQTDVTNYTYPATVTYFYLLSGDGGVSSKLATASGYLKASDPSCAGVTDARACVDLVQSGASSPSAVYPVDITNSAELQQALAAPGNIKVVGQITYCDNETGSYSGCTWQGQRDMVIRQDCRAGVLAHEFGHAQNNPDEPFGACHYYVMYPSDQYEMNVLTAEEANLFITPRPGYTFWNGSPCQIALPDVFHSYFVPQSGSTAAPLEGNAAMASFRSCPDNEGGGMLPNNARLKIVLHDSNDAPLAGIQPADICILFNGGTPAQGFTGMGDDSIAANNSYHPTMHCPDLRCLQADAPTDASGVTYITFIGHNASDPPGVGSRDGFRKWGNWSGDVPVFAQGVQLQGKLTSGSPLGSYQAHIRSLDTQGNTTNLNDVSEIVNSLDVNAVQSSTLPNGSNPDDPDIYRFDFDHSGYVNSADLNLIKSHILPQGGIHRCDYPLSY